MTTTQEKIDTFFKQFTTQTFRKNHVLLAAGSTTNSFYYLESGAVKMSRVSKDGKNLVLHIFFPKSYFSLLTLVNRSNDYDFTTLMPTTIRKVPETELLSFLQNNNDVFFELHLRLLKGLSGLLKRLEQNAFTTANQQIASLLLFFAGHFTDSTTPAKNAETINIKLTHQEIADWLGLSRENVTLNLNLLSQQALIKIEHHEIEIMDLQKLRDWSAA